MLEKVRENIFYVVDTVRHKSVRKHYKDILNIQSSKYDFQADRLRRILEYAIHNVPFYKGIKEANIFNFPVMSKFTYKEQGLRCRSKEYLDDGKLFIASTSG